MNREQLCDAMRTKWYLTTEEIDAILADPNFFQPYLRESLAHRAAVAGAPESPVDATDWHAIFLLTEMQDSSIIPDLLKCLRMSEGELNLLYADTLTENMWLPFAVLGSDYLEQLWQFVTDASVYEFARLAVITGVVGMHHFNPTSRASSVTFVERLLRHHDDGNVNRTGCFPDDYIAATLCDCGDSGLTELAKQAEQFAASMEIDEDGFPMATADNVREAFRNGRGDFLSRRAHNVYSVNRQSQRWVEMNEDENRKRMWPDWLTPHKELIEKIRETVSSRFVDRRAENTPSIVWEQFELAMRLSNVITTAAEMDQLEDAIGTDVAGWLLDLPFELARVGMAQQAADVGRIWANVIERANFLGDRAVILAEKDRREEAHQQIEEALSEFPDDIWVRIKVGDAHRALGELGKAEECYRCALAMPQKKYDREGIIERLVPMLQELGRGDEAAALEAEEEISADEEEEELTDEQLVPPIPLRRSSPKTGRNNPCPCGSGKKYKKCHGR